MRYQYQLLLTLALLLGGMAAADSVVKTLYIDGVYIGEATTDAALVWPYDKVLIGAEGNTGYVYNGLVGKIDEFAIYSGVLSASRVAVHYGAASSGYATQVLADLPLIYLQFEDPNTTSGVTVANSGSATANTATFAGSVTSAAGAVGQAAEFHGTGEGGVGDYVAILDSNKALSQIDVTIECWVQTITATNYPRLFQRNGSWETNTSYGAIIADANSLAITGGNSTDFMAAQLADGNWHHVVITYDSTVDEVEYGEYSEEVMADGPVLYLQFEGTTPVDSSGNNYWVSYNSGVQARPYLGIGDAVYLPNSGTNAIGAANQQTAPSDFTVFSDNYAFAPDDITFEFWMKSSGMDSYGMFFQQIKSDETKAPGMGNSGGTIRILNGKGGFAYTGVTTPLDDKWHHMVVSYDWVDSNNMTIKLYVDGANVSTKAITSTANDVKIGPELSTLVIGGENTYTSTWNRYYGMMDEFAVYPSVLSDERVAIHYAAGLEGMKGKTCEEIWLKGDGLAVDTNQDCNVDLTDFVVIALDWLACNDPASIGTDPICIANW